MSSTEGLTLKRRVGLFGAISLTTGCVIGSGIFVSAKSVLERTGSVALTLIIWPLCGIFCMLASLCYVELGLAIPLSGGEYSYCVAAFGPFPAYMIAWISVFLVKSATLAIVCLTFAEYVVLGISSHACDQDLQVKILCVLCIGKTENLRTGFKGSTTSISSGIQAFYGGLWSYDGWNQLAYVMEELERPEKNLPRSVYLGMPLVILCYTLVNVAYLAVLTPEEIYQSETVAVTFASKIHVSLAVMIPVLVAISCFGTANGTAFASGRLCFAAARNNHLMEILSYIDINTYLPTPALYFNSFLALVLVLASNIEQLIDVFGFSAWLFYGGACFSLLVLRFTKKDLPRPYKVSGRGSDPNKPLPCLTFQINICIPILVTSFSVCMVVAPFIQEVTIEYIYAACFIILGAILYIPFVRYKLRIPRYG